MGIRCINILIINITKFMIYKQLCMHSTLKMKVAESSKNWYPSIKLYIYILILVLLLINFFCYGYIICSVFLVLLLQVVISWYWNFGHTSISISPDVLSGLCLAYYLFSTCDYFSFYLIQSRIQWKYLMYTVPMKGGEFIDHLSNCHGYIVV
jgi:hypothetical protein